MPLETKKVLWTVLSVVMVLIVVSGITLALVYPRGASRGAPATVAAVAPPRTATPDEYVRAVEPVPVPAAPVAAAQPSAGSDIIIVYGEKPASATLPEQGLRATGTASSQTSTATATATATATTTKPYTPAPATATVPGAAKPAAASQAAPSAVKPASKAAAPVTVSEYWIQAAAFTSRSRADDLQRELASKGLSTLITVKDLDGISWYRVRIGPYQSESEAKGWLKQILPISGCGEAYVSKQSVQRSS